MPQLRRKQPRLRWWPPADSGAINVETKNTVARWLSHQRGRIYAPAAFSSLHGLEAPKAKVAPVA